MAWVPALAWVWSLARELLHALCMAKKKKKREMTQEVETEEKAMCRQRQILK